MKRWLLTLFLSLLIIFPVFSSSLSIGVDLGALDSFFLDGKRVGGAIGFRYGKIRASLDLQYAFDLEREYSLLDVGASIDVYPFSSLGLFFGVDLLRYGRFFGAGSPVERNIFFSSIRIGWTFSFPYFYIEPRLVITDPARLSQDSLSSLSESFLYYGNYYFALMIGIQIDGL